MIKLYNTLERKIVEFKPLNKKQVTFYSCGPTVYDYQHIGNMRAFIFADIVERVLELNGYKVKHVINITDVGHLVSDANAGEDKMVKALKREGLDFTLASMMKLAKLYTDKFLEDLKDLNVESPDKWTKATKHVKEMIKLVDKLIKDGYVYETSTAFYFDTSKMKDYGKLGNLQEDELKAGARVEVDAEKRNPADFAVWMKAVGKHEHHVMLWSAPFSKVKGFPGWHIECSAMSMKYLGETIDIHSGGIDHIKVHHTNEIAQSEAYTKKPFVRYWLHNEFLVLDKGKMSKSAGTFITLQDLKDKGYDPLAYRFLCLMAHYRSPLTFSYEGLDGAQAGLVGLRKKILELGKKTGRANREYANKFIDFVNDDFNTPQAIALVYGVLKDGELSDADKLATILEFDEVLGLGLDDIKIAKKEKAPKSIVELAAKRVEAKKNKDYKLADDIRNRIEGEGWIIEDSQDGFGLKPKK